MALQKFDKDDQPTVVKKGRKKHGDHGGHGAAWKVAFADFCLALLALFLVMWLLATRQAEQLQVLLQRYSMIDNAAGRRVDNSGQPRGSLIDRYPMPSSGEQLAKRAVNDGEQEPFGPGQGPRTAEKARLVYATPQDMRELADVFTELSQQTGLSSNVRSIVTPFGLRVLLHDTDGQGMFVRGSATPSEPFQKLLQKIGPLFADIENQMLVVGHTDSVQYANRSPQAMSNWRLSTDRAMAARTSLLQGGMPEKSVLQVVGLADAAPYNPQDTAASENRRIELVILTSSQAQSIAAMYGAPVEADTRPLVDGVVTSVTVPQGAPEYDAVAALREQVAPR